MEQKIFYTISAALVIGIGALGFFIFDLRKKWYAMFGGAETHDKLLAKILNEHEVFKEGLQKHETRIKVVEAIAGISVQKVGFIRFNPFSETGGDNSFALTLLDRGNNGVIISSLYAREGVRVYGKSVESGVSKHPLSQEEQESLRQALNG